MCITSGPAFLENTIIYAGESTDKNGKIIHVLSYKNKAKSLTDKVNSMILPIPSSEDLSKQNIVDMSSCKDLLSKYYGLFEVKTRGFLKGGKEYNLNFEIVKSGSYTIILAKNAQSIRQAIDILPINERPEIHPDLIQSFQSLYKDWTLAVCCWSGSIDPEPITIWYYPKDENRLFIPTMDSHTGGPPDLNSSVRLNHSFIIGGSVLTDKPVDISLNRDCENLFSKYVLGVVNITAKLPNGDFYVDIRDHNNIPCIKNNIAIMYRHNLRVQNAEAYEKIPLKRPSI